MMVNWTKEWPTDPGYYWFYGWCFRDRHREPKLHFVKIRQIANGITRVTDGHFLYKAEGGGGYWVPAITPTLPDELFDSLVEQMEKWYMIQFLKMFWRWIQWKLSDYDIFWERGWGIYCPRCGACGEEGCCPASKCDHGIFCAGYYEEAE